MKFSRFLLQVISFLLPLYLVSTTTQRSIPFRHLLDLLFQGHQDSLLFSGVFIAEEVGGVVGRVLGDTIVDIQTVL
jgi:hypothetical protein